MVGGKVGWLQDWLVTRLVGGKIGWWQDWLVARLIGGEAGDDRSIALAGMLLGSNSA